MFAFPQGFSPVLKTFFQPNLPRSPWQQVALLILRGIVGAVMIHNGFDKLADIEGFASAYVEVIGLPFPIFFAYVAAFTELGGSVLLILGFLTRAAAFGLFSTMAVAVFHHIKVAGFSIPYLELSVLYAACFLFLSVNGPGWYSLDQLIHQWLENRTQNQQAERIESLHQSFQVTERMMEVSEDAVKR
ncbi:MAG: DoxX family protein [Synechococcaceae cyanobacterium SM2_3_1]|nr:DoxX family protein [Synechococcaceae cyanobacterium SM2_3_1]